ncbi:DUF192 domain-containing protein [Blattabacterium cuenoti]|uniref:DUF192 domain-containing protein n=1 Tax=Blattabacterium cuenoti TaxID=1653831 RepID=UPI001EECCB54|nr:DUF192 domain-containing protein [Blattabacterium cuenoti]
MRNNNIIIKKIDIEFAKEEIEKKNGLKYRSFLKYNRGLLFIFNNKKEIRTVNMENMRFPIDIIYIDKFNTVIGIYKNATPMRKINVENLIKFNDIKYVLEVNSGMSDKWKIKEGLTKISYILKNN